MAREDLGHLAVMERCMWSTTAIPAGSEPGRCSNSPINALRRPYPRGFRTALRIRAAGATN
jgi:hypothetical protein